MARALLALRRARGGRRSRRCTRATRPTTSSWPAGRFGDRCRASTPRFVFDQHDAAPVLLAEKFPQTPLAAR